MSEHLARNNSQLHAKERVHRLTPDTLMAVFVCAPTSNPKEEASGTVPQIAACLARSKVGVNEGFGGVSEKWGTLINSTLNRRTPYKKDPKVRYPNFWKPSFLLGSNGKS